MKIEGKWSRNKYKLISLVGLGNFGTVYKVEDAKGCIRAMKISKDTLSITNEYNAMVALQDMFFIPRVYEFDDWEYNGNILHYIVMEYIPGNNLKEIAEDNSLKPSTILKIGLILINMFRKIDGLGYKYTDIKLENIILANNGRIYFIDFGGLVERGKPTKEYTPVYNINSWRVDFSYNIEMGILFSITMIMITLIGNMEYNPLVYDLEQVRAKVQTFPLKKEEKQFLHKALRGKYKTFNQYENALASMLKGEGYYKTLSKIDYVLIASIVSFVFVIIIGIRYIYY